MKIILTVLLIYCHLTAFGQGITISGVVMNLQTNEPLITEVVLTGNSTLRRHTESTGYFTFDSIPAGQYKLIVDVKGYKSFEKEIILTDLASAARDYGFIMVQMVTTDSKIRSTQIDYTEYDKLNATYHWSTNRIAGMEDFLRVVDRTFTPQDEEYFNAYYTAGSYYNAAGMTKEAIISYNKAIEAYEKYFPFVTRYAYPMVTKETADYIYYLLGAIYSQSRLYESCVRYFEAKRSFFMNNPSASIRLNYLTSLAYAYSGAGNDDKALVTAEELMKLIKSGKPLVDPAPLQEYKPGPSDTEETRKLVQDTYDKSNAMIRKNNERTALMMHYSTLFSYHNIVSMVYQNKYDYEKIAINQKEGIDAYRNMMKVVDDMMKESEIQTKNSGAVQADSTRHQLELSRKYTALAMEGLSFWPVLAYSKIGKPEEAKQFITGNLGWGIFYMLNNNYPEAEKNFALHTKKFDVFKSDKVYADIVKTLKQTWLQYTIRLHALQQKYPQAIEDAQLLITDYEKKFKTGFSYMTETEKKELFKDYTKQLDFYFSILLSAAEKDKERANEMLNKVLQTKGIILEYTKKQNEKLKDLKDPVIRDYITKIRSLRAKQSSFSEMKLKDPNPQWTDSLLSNGKKINDLEQKINQRLGASEDFFTTVTWKDIQKKLKPGEVYLDIVRVSRDNFKYDKPKIQYWAFVIKSGSSSPEYFMLSEGDAFETRSLRFYQNSIRNILDDDQSYDTYWKSIGLSTEGIPKVFFAPDGVYHLVNPLTLQNPLSKKFLLDETEIIRLSSGRDFIAMTKSVSGLQSVTLVGNPDFQMSRKSGTPSSKQSGDLLMSASIRSGVIMDLPGTEKEVNLIRAQVSAKGFKTITYYGKEANETNIKKITSPSVLHFATHGIFDDIQDKSDSYLKSKLVLAGAGDVEPFSIVDYEKYEDGFLTGYEVTQMNLQQTQLVILSACETGLGDLQGGEGVWGLQRAFQMAGSNAVMGSLWKINDETTVYFMDDFYKNWLSGSTFQQSYKKAMLSTRNRFNHPYYWGAFLLL